ncbi:hypothetical protein N7G274_006815 [Stereocaulon virgatum]|uniref:RING-type domain-containing protein n=1 Tax=Stereocaulon virgatum TaxID=373712 RepID=A0ABR4A366_9LECA
MPGNLSITDRDWLRRIRKVAIQKYKQTPEVITNFMTVFDGSSALGDAMVFEYCVYREELGLSTIIRHAGIGMRLISPRQLHNMGEEDRDTCDICHEKYLTGDDPEEPVQLKCDHIFGKTCISSWTVGDGVGTPHPSCPMCRAELVQNTYLLDAEGSTPPQAIPLNVQSIMSGIVDILQAHARDPKSNEQAVEPAISVLALSERYYLPPKHSMSAAEIYLFMNENEQVKQHPNTNVPRTLRVFEVSAQIEACRQRLLPALRLMGAETLWDSQPFTIWNFVYNDRLPLVADFVEQLVAAEEFLDEARNVVASTSAS